MRSEQETVVLPMGCSTIGYGMLALDEALTRIAHLGFQDCEIGVLGRFCPHLDPLKSVDDTVAECSALLRKHNLRVSALNSAPRIYARDAEDVDELGRVAGRLLRICEGLRCDLILDVGERSADHGATRRRTTTVVGEAFRRGRDEHGVTVTIEAPHRGAVAQTIGEAVALLHDIGEEDLGITYDTSHATCGGVTVTEGLDLIGPRIDRVQARDLREDDIHLTPGDGDYDWRELLRFLRCSPKPLFLELEFDHRLSPDQVDVEVERARGFLQSSADH